MSLELREHIHLSLEGIRGIAVRLQKLSENARAALPGDVETMAAAALLHSFYTGIEGIFKAIAVEIDGGVPRDPAWHRELLRQMTLHTPQRGPVISAELEDRIKPFVAFRHLFRGASILLMRWDRLSPLVDDAPGLIGILESDLNRFLGRPPKS